MKDVILESILRQELLWELLALLAWIHLPIILVIIPAAIILAAAEIFQEGAPVTVFDKDIPDAPFWTKEMFKEFYHEIYRRLSRDAQVEFVNANKEYLKDIEKNK